jgi:hypothetical protein
MVANGNALSTSVLAGEQPVGQAGTIVAIGVLVQAGSDTLDRVQLFVNGLIVFDSGTGLGITVGLSYISAPGVAVLATNRVELRAFKAGVIGTMALRARLVVQ